MDTASVEQTILVDDTVDTSSQDPIAEFKAPGVFVKLYEKTSKEGKPAVFGRFVRRRQRGEEWEDNPWINSLSDLDHIIEVCLLAKQKMRDFYVTRDK